MRRSEIIVGLFVLLSGCAASLPLEEHRAALATQQADYEARLKRVEEDRRREEEACARAASDGNATIGELKNRVHNAEVALAELGKEGDGARIACSDRSGRSSSVLAQALSSALGAESGLETKHGVVIAPLDRFFAPGSTRLSEEGTRHLALIARAIAPLKKRRLTIAVHADAVPVDRQGPVADSWELTQRQGRAVAEALVAAGVVPAGVVLVAYGHYSPRAANDSDEDRAKNRRVELSVD